MNRAAEVVEEDLLENYNHETDADDEPDEVKCRSGLMNGQHFEPLWLHFDFGLMDFVENHMRPSARMGH